MRLSCFKADVSGLPIGPTFNGIKLLKEDSLTLEYATDRYSRIVGFKRRVITQKKEEFNGYLD
jgi:hypothetical protein